MCVWKLHRGLPALLHLPSTAAATEPASLLASLQVYVDTDDDVRLARR